MAEKWQSFGYRLGLEGYFRPPSSGSLMREVRVKIAQALSGFFAGQLALLFFFFLLFVLLFLLVRLVLFFLAAFISHHASPYV
jgi:hypothetical protein